MLTRPCRIVSLAGIVVVFLAAVEPCQAQSGAALMIKPWADGVMLEFDNELTFQARGHTTSSAAPLRFGLWQWDATGRFRFDATVPHSIAVGYDVLAIDFTERHPLLPSQLVDASGGIGVPIAEYEGWEIGATLGAGYAGDTPFDESDAVYAIANVIFSYELDPDAGWQVLINYNGNRTLWPDVPLPGVAYYDRIDDLSYTLGVPYSSATWQPLDGLTLHVNYAVPLSFNGRIGYEVIEGVELYGKLETRFNAFQLDGSPEHTRIFFRQRRAELGVDWTPCDFARFKLAGGYAFDQEFRTGFDARDLDHLVTVSDEPYVRFAIDLDF